MGLELDVDLTNLLDRLDVGFAVIGVGSGRFLEVSAPTCRFLGRSEAELRRLTLASLVPEADLDALRIIAERRVSGQHTATQDLLRFVRPDGEIVYGLLTSIVREGRDELCFVSQVLDVTDREQATENLRIVMDNSPVSVYLIDRNARVLSSGGHMYGGVAKALEIGKQSSLFEVVTDAPDQHVRLRRALGGEAMSRVVAYRGYYFDMYLRPLLDANGEVEAVAAISTDVTARERTLRELEVRAAGQALTTDLARLALDAAEPARLWNRAVSGLAELLGATAAMHDLVPGADGLRPVVVTRAGPRPPAPVSASTVAGAARVLRPSSNGASSNGASSRGAAPTGADQGEGRSPRPSPAAGPRTVLGWATMTVPVGRTDRPRGLLSVYRPGRQTKLSPSGRTIAVKHPRAGRFAAHETDLVHAVASVLGSAAVRFEMERDIRHRSLHDALTGLPNRAYLLDQLDRSLSAVRRGRRRTGVVFVDLDGFKTVNDTWGHGAGDAVLRQAAARLRSSVRPDDMVARLAGDEFAVVCDHVETPAEVQRIARRILAAVAAPMHFGEPSRTVTITASVGVAVSGAALRDPDRLLGAADLAMYAAKRAGGDRSVDYEASMELTIRAGPRP